MKKIALVAVLATSAAMAAPFNGFSVGGDLGASFNKFTGVQADGVKSTGKKTSMISSLFVGYAKSFNNMFVGLDLGLGFEGKANYDRKNAAGTKLGTVYLKPGISFEMNPRVGYKFNDTMAGYFKLGMGVAKNEWKLKNLAGTETAKGKRSVVSFTPTLGLEKAFGNVSMRGELGYKMTGNKKVFKTATGTAAEQAATLDTKIKRKAVVMTVGVAYNF
ncbi:MAG TPA: hypothetical protein DIC42_06795 [Holosporales bacterium]|nr:hypothetical protein [Holosporales bacterium]